MSRAPKRALAGGEIDPDLWYGSDLIPVRTGAAIVKNFIVRPKGGVERRPGTEHLFVGTNGAARIRLGGFTRSGADSYIAEIGDNFIRFQRADRPASDGTSWTIATPWAGADLDALQFVQSNDVQWVFSGGPIMEIRRVDDAAGPQGIGFRLVPAAVNNGPFLEQNVAETSIVTASGIEGAITLAASDPIFSVGHIGALFRLEEQDYSGVAKWTTEIAILLGQKVRYNGRVYQCVKDGRTSENPPTHSEGVESDGTEDGRVEWLYLHSGFGLVRITGFTDARTVSATVTRRLPESVRDAGTWKWSEGAWSDRRGYPRTGALYKSALWAGGTTFQPEWIWKSAIEGFDDWEAGTEDDRALGRGLYDGSTEAVRWMAASSYLAIGTDGPEWLARPDAAGDTVRVNNLITEIATDRGSSDVSGVVVNGQTVFLDQTRRHLAQMAYDFRRDAWIARDLSLLAGHILRAGAIEMAYQRAPWPVFWCLLGDGTLAGLTYLPDQEVLAWHRHEFAGKVESIQVLPVDGGRREALFLAVRHATAAGEAVHVERMFEGFSAARGDTIASAQYLQSARMFHFDEPSDAIFNLGHLEGREVAVLVDGKSHPPITIQFGIALLEIKGREILVGLPYESCFETLPYDMGLPDEFQAGRRKRVSDLYIALRSELGGEILIDGQAQKVTRLGAAALDRALDLNDAVVRIDPPAADHKGQIRYVNASAWPATITAIFPEFED